MQTGDVADSITLVHEKIRDLSKLAANLSGVVASFNIKADLLQWSDDLSVNISRIDSQHKQLVTLINRLNGAMSDGTAKDAALQILNELAEYTVNHFGTEEELFETYDFPQKESHKKIHRELVAKVVAFKTDFESGKAMLSRDLMIFLKEWLINHIKGTDAHYGPFLNKHGVQ
jgi:methyl-accepting chemotaxis protein/hemerythrin